MTVSIDDTSHEVTIKPVDLVAFERKYDVAWEAVQNSPRIEYVYFLAWNASRRTGITEDDFDAWLDRVEDLDPIEEPPLEPAAANS